MTDTKGKVVGINGNMVSVQFDGNISMNEVAYVQVEGTKLRGEVIRIRGDVAQLGDGQKIGSTASHGGCAADAGNAQEAAGVVLGLDAAEILDFDIGFR